MKEELHELYKDDPIALARLIEKQRLTRVHPVVDYRMHVSSFFDLFASGESSSEEESVFVFLCFPRPNPVPRSQLVFSPPLEVFDSP